MIYCKQYDLLQAVWGTASSMGYCKQYDLLQAVCTAEQYIV